MSSSAPSANDFDSAMQNVRNTLQDPELARGTPDLDPYWQTPTVFSGNFALTYPMTLPGGDRVAVRCFNRIAVGIEGRYKAISDSIAKLAARDRRHFVGFQFQSQGIRVRSRLHPIVRMDWAGGKTLGDYLEEHVSRPERVAALAAALLSLARTLERIKIAHGDIAPGNVMVEEQPDGPLLRLIDYDGMWVPALEELGSSERGQVNFQHPGRNDQWGPTLDRFSFTAIYVALKCLEARPPLWSETGSGAESIMFRRSDYSDPVSSVLFARLGDDAFPDAHARDLAMRFATLCGRPYGGIPTLEEFLNSSGTGSSGWMTGVAASVRSPLGGIPRRQGAALYEGPYRVLKANVFEDCLPWLGNRVELVGKVREVRRGTGPRGSHVFLSFGTYGQEDQVTVQLWSEFLARHSEPDKSWVDTWISVICVPSRIVPSRIERLVWGRRTSNLTAALQVSDTLLRIDETDARFRLASVPTIASNQAVPGVPKPRKFENNQRGRALSRAWDLGTWRQVTVKGGGRYEVPGSQPGTSYTLSTGRNGKISCTCAAALDGKHCYHWGSVTLHMEQQP